MYDSVTAIRKLMLRELGTLERELALFPDDESVWRTLPGVTNSAGTLALHLAGNLQHYLGAVLGGSGYVRDREREFAARGLGRDELGREIARARAAVERVLPALDDAALSRQYPEAVGGRRLATGLFLQHLAVHLAFHLGQLGYLRRAVTGDGRSSVPISIAAIADRAGDAG